MILKIYKIQDNGIWIPKNELEEWYNHYTKLSVRLSKDNIEMAMYYAGIADTTSDGKQVVFIDSCEYIKYSNGYGAHYSHKGNCRFCAERRKQELESLIEQLKGK